MNRPPAWWVHPLSLAGPVNIFLRHAVLVAGYGYFRIKVNFQ
jgi:hypothetical protein